MDENSTSAVSCADRFGAVFMPFFALFCCLSAQKKFDTLLLGMFDTPPLTIFDATPLNLTNGTHAAARHRTLLNHTNSTLVPTLSPNRTNGTQTQDRAPPPSGGGQRRGCPGTLLVVVRVYAPQEPLIVRLLRSLADEPAKKYGEQCVRFLLVPTQVEDLGTFRQYVRTVNLASAFNGAYQIEVPPNLEESVYKQAAHLEQKCSPNISSDWESFLRAECTKKNGHTSQSCLQTWGPNDMFRKICVYSNFVHYYLVDRAIDYALEAYHSPKGYLLVTNGDNTYEKSFFDRTVADSHAHGCLVGVNFDRRVNGSIKPAPFGTVRFDRLGGIDLGAGVVNLQFIRESGVRFLTSAPQYKTDPYGVRNAKAIHDLDFWWFHKLVGMRNCTARIIRTKLFHHQ